MIPPNHSFVEVGVLKDYYFSYDRNVSPNTLSDLNNVPKMSFSLLETLLVTHSSDVLAGWYVLIL